MLLALLCLIVAGCSSDGRLTVSGTVTLDGKPLEDGGVTFQPALGSDGHSAGGQIKDGEFHLPANHGLKEGKYTVAVRAFRLTGRIVDAPMVGKVPEKIPVTYNEADNLEATVAAGTANHFDFHLTTAGAGS